MISPARMARPTLAYPNLWLGPMASAACCFVHPGLAWTYRRALIIWGPGCFVVMSVV